MRAQLLRPLALCGVVMLPALAMRGAGLSPAPAWGLLAFGAAVVAASFVLAWAAEAAQVDMSGGLAIAILAVVAVLPEYAVDLYFAYVAGRDPAYVAYAAANMTGSNRLLLGLGWAVVVIIALALAKRRTKVTARELVMDSGYRVELGFLALASLLALVIPATGQLSLWLGLLLLGWFVFYLWKMARSEASEPDLVGPAATIGQLPKRPRRILVTVLFATAAAVILVSAEPFADALIATGTQLGIDQFLLVQWLAPLSSEAPEFIVAILFAVRGKGAVAIGTLISSKVNQWTLLIGSLPVTYLLGGGTATLPLDPRQIEEFLLTATQTVLGVSVLLALRFPRWAAWTLLSLFAVQFVLPGQTARYILAALYTAVAITALIRNRHHIVPTLTAPFRTLSTSRENTPSPVLDPPKQPSGAGTDATEPHAPRVEIRYVPNCPHVEHVRETLQAALARTHPGVEIVERTGEYASPTLLIDGHDVTGRTPTTGSSCRLDLPTEDQIRTALHDHRVC